MRRFLGLLMLLAAPLAFGQYSRFDLSLQTAPGQAISGASVWILTQPNSCTPLGNGRSSCATLAPLAPLFANLTGAASPVNCGVLSGTGNQIQNPGKTNQFGAFCNYVTPGLYTVCYNSPYTGQICYPDQSPVGGSGGVGSGTVTDFFAGNLVPLFTTAVATPTTTPSLTFALSNAPNYTLFGNFTGSTAAPSYTHLATAGSLSSSYNSGSNTLTLTGGTGLAIQHNDSASGINQTNLDFNDTNPAPDAGFESVTFKTDSTGRLAGEVPLSPPASVAPLVTAPVAGQYVILYPHVATVTERDDITVPTYGFATGKAAGGVVGMNTSCSLSFTNAVQWSGYTLADYPTISPSDVTAVYAFAVSSYGGQAQGRLCFFTPGSFVYASEGLSTGSGNLLPVSPSIPYPLQQVTASTSITGTGIATATSGMTITISGDTQIKTNLTVNSIGLIVYYTGTPVTNPSNLNIAPPLTYDESTNTLGVDQNYPLIIHGYPLGSQPTPQVGFNTSILITGTLDCQTSSGSALDAVLCKENLTGTTYTWVPMFSGGSGSVSLTSPSSTLSLSPSTITGAGTLDLNLAHANTWSALQTLSAGLNLSGASSPLEVGGSAGSSGQCLISAGAGATPIYGTCATGSSGISGATTGQALIAGSATTATSSKALAGSGAGLTTGPTSSTNLDCAQFSGTTGQIADAGAPCGSGGGTPPATFPIDTYGGVGDGNLSANTGTDNTSAFTSALAAAVAAGGGTITFDCAKQYKFTAGIPAITHSGIWLAGACPLQLSTNHAISTPMVFTASATATVVDFHGSNTTTGLIVGNGLKDLSVNRAVPPTTGSVGVNVVDAGGFFMNRVTSDDSNNGFNLNYTPFFGYGGFFNSQATWCAAGVTSTGTLHGWTLANVGQSTVMDSDGAADECAGTTYGIYAPSGLVDYMVNNFQSSLVRHAIYIDGTGNTTKDAHFTNSILDGCSTDCIFATHINTNLTFDGGWANSQSGNYDIDIESSNGVTVSGMQALVGSSGGTLATIYLNATGTSIVSNNNVQPLNGAPGILLNASTFNTISGNQIFGNGGSTPSALIKFTGSSTNSVQSNSLATGTIGISLDGSSNNNKYANFNTIDPASVTTPISDAGTGNQFNTIATATNLAGGALGSVPYQNAPSTTAMLASPTTSGHVFAETWQPTGSAIAPTALDLNTWNAAFNSVSTGSGATGCGSATGCVALAESGTAGTPAAANDYFRADTSHNLLASINGAAEAPVAIRLPIGNVTFTPGSGVTSASCASSYTCTNSRGEFTLIGGTATTGTIATVNFSTTLGAAPFCTVSVNGNGGSSTTSFDLGHGLPSTSSFTVTAGVTVIGATINIDYQCQ